VKLFQCVIASEEVWTLSEGKLAWYLQESWFSAYPKYPPTRDSRRELFCSCEAHLTTCWHLLGASQQYFWGPTSQLRYSRPTRWLSWVELVPGMKYCLPTFS
jgi:hypothetical protein